MRVPQQPGSKGSLKWIQLLINQPADLLSDKICEQAPDLYEEAITWFSPLKSDQFAEYRDRSFLVCLGFQALSAELADFWPRRGPQWDALGITSQGYPLLVEAKANIPELISHCGAKDPNSLRLITKRLKETQKWLGCRSIKDWTRYFYQYQIAWHICTSCENSRGKMPFLSLSTSSMTLHTFPHHSRNGVAHCSYRRS